MVDVKANTSQSVGRTEQKRVVGNIAGGKAPKAKGNSEINSAFGKIYSYAASKAAWKQKEICKAVEGQMKYAIMSNVHSNPKALETALADAKALGCERFVMLGDTTGYGYDVKTSLKLVRGSFDVVLMGNHDSAALGRESDLIMRLNGNYDIDVAQGRILTKCEADWLGKLPFVHVEGGAAFAHGNFVRPESWDYVTDEASARASFRARSERFMFCGHTHAAEAWELADGRRTIAVWRGGGKVRLRDRRRIRLPLFKSAALKPESKGFKPRKGRRYIVNVGSVGYPRHDLCSTYVIWDPETDCVTFRRLPFDFKGYINGMLEHKIALPDWLVKLLLMVVK